MLDSALAIPLSDSKAITAQSKSNFSSAFFFLPKEKRIAIRRVYAFFRIVDDVVDEEADPVRAKAMLNSLRQELLQTYQGNPQHPLFAELKESIDRYKIPADYFLKLIEGCEMDMTKSRYETFEELYEYCYRVASMVGLVCMKIFEYQSPTSDKTAIDLGIALQLTNIIRDMGVDLKKNRIYIPQCDLKKFGLTEMDLKKGVTDHRFEKLMEAQYQRALSFYDSGFAEFSKDKNKKLLAAKIMGVVYRKILKKIREKNYPVLQYKVRLSFFEKCWILTKVLGRYYLL